MEPPAIDIKPLRDMDRQTEVGSQPDPTPDANEEAFAFPETVCHRTITGELPFYPQAEFHGRTIYFCTETCQSVFLSDPERFFAAHSKRRP
jgi:YHS domain-containing protein